MARVEVNGIGIAYDIIGTGDRSIAITAGGRFSRDTPGLRGLAEQLAGEGNRVLIWDRPNCGESDFCFSGESESITNVGVLGALLKELDFGPTLLVGGSAGSRLSLMTAIRYPESVSGLYLLWISGGWLGLAVLANHYYFDSAFAAVSGGMEAVSALPEWQEQLQRNPGNRERLLALDPEEFIATMQRWAGSFFPRSEAPVPGLDPDELANIKAPTVILRSGKSDLHHTRETSEQLHKMMPGSDLREPPWGDNEWNEAMVRSEVDDALFKSWPQLAPDIIRFTKTI